MKKYLITVSVLLLITSSSYSQRKFTLNLYGGYTLSVADLRGDFPDTLGSTYLDFRKSKTLLTSSGFNFGALCKFAVDSAGSQRLTAGFNFNSFSGKMDYTGTRNVSYKNKVSIITLSAGLEYDINPSKKFVPFVGLDISANIYGGKIEGSGDTIVILNRKTEARFGVIATAGIDIKLWKSSGIVAGVKYALTNLIGKSSEITTSTPTIPITDDEEQGGSSGSELPLNDKATTSMPDKSLNYLQFYVGISVYFGSKLGNRK